MTMFEVENLILCHFEEALATEKSIFLDSNFEKYYFDKELKYCIIK